MHCWRKTASTWSWARRRRGTAPHFHLQRERAGIRLIEKLQGRMSVESRLYVESESSMGWRGAMRSLSAAARRAEREQQRQANQEARLHRKAQSLLDSLSHEAERSLRKVEAFEEKIYQAPVKTLKLRYDESDAWICQPLVEQTRQLSYSIGPRFVSDAVSFGPTTIEFEGRLFSLLAFCATEYATFVAIAVENSKRPGAGRKSRRILNKSNPEESSVFLISDEQVFYAFDGNIDGPIPGAARKIGIIAFEPLVTPTNTFQLAFVPRPTKRNPDPDALMINVAGPELSQTIESFSNSASLVDQFQRQINSQLAITTNEIESSLPNKGGCLSMFALIVILTGSLAWAIGFG